MMPPEMALGLDVGASQVHQGSPKLHAARKPRDLFPLPLLRDEAQISYGLSRKARRKQLWKGHLGCEVNHTIRALNSMYGGDGKQHRPGQFLIEEDVFGEGSAQWDCIEHIESMVHKMGKPPSELTGRGALSSLQAASGYTGDQPVGSLASFNPEAISLPQSGWDPIDLADLWGDDGRSMVNEFVSTQVLPIEEASAKLEACGVKQPYSDPMLRQGKVYHNFLRRLHESKLIDFSDRPGKEKIAFFCVSKKNGRLRLIVDARRANAHFSEPTHVNLSTGDGLGGIEIGDDDTLCIATADLKDAFYHLSLPAEIRDFFTLTAVRASDVGITSLGGRKLSKFARITPRLAVVPMGWSWALFLCQSVHEALALKAGLREENRLRDRQPAPRPDVFHTQYVDNMIVMGTDEKKVESSFKSATKVLRDSGLQVHEEEFSTDGAKILGWEFTKDGGFKPGHHRVWKLRLAIRALLDHGPCSAHLMEKLVGHCCFVAL